MASVVPFVVPSKELKQKQIKFAEELFKNATPWRKALITNTLSENDYVVYEFGVFAGDAGLIVGVKLVRNAEGKITEVGVMEFTTWPDANIWFREELRPLI